MDYLSALNKRRSYYAIDKNIAVDINDVKKLLESIVISTPSAYNSQSQRMVLLLNDQHNWLWDKLIEKMKSILNEDQ